MLAIIFKYYTPEKKTLFRTTKKIVTDEQKEGLVALTLFFNTM